MTVCPLRDIQLRIKKGTKDYSVVHPKLLKWGWGAKLSIVQVSKNAKPAHSGIFKGFDVPNT